MDIPKKIGRYEIIEELGHGAMGTVYRAKDPSMDRVVALKTIIALALASEQGSEFRERFFREARAAGGLAHPGIVPVFDVGEHEGLPYLVMEFVAGHTLANAAKKGERLSIDRVCEIGQKVAEALGYAHQRGVVHRDIKPANILLTSIEIYGIERPKITDFGVAKLTVGSTTVTGQILGTPAFMPPEQFTGSPIDGRADIYSLGVVLYWMATGEQPFPGESVTAVSYKVVHTDPVPPRKLNPAIPAKLESVILKCLAKSPADRYQTGEELSQDLRDVRSTPKSTAASYTAPTAANDPEATFVESHPRQTYAAPPAPPVPVPPSMPQQPGPVPITSSPKNNAPKSSATSRIIAAAAVILLVLAGGIWFAKRGKENAANVASTAAPAPSVTVPSAPPVATATNSVAVAVASKKIAVTSSAESSGKEGAASVASADTSAAKRLAKNESNPGATLVAAGPRAVAGPPLDFDPKALNPKENAKLKIDDKHMPQDLAYTVEMNGKLYFQKTAGAATKTEDEKLFVPPGVQEFRVKASSGVVQKISNTVSAEFRAKKKNTLRIELRTQGGPDGTKMPAGLYTDTQIFIGLK